MPSMMLAPLTMLVVAMRNFLPTHYVNDWMLRGSRQNTNLDSAARPIAMQQSPCTYNPQGRTRPLLSLVLEALDKVSDAEY